MLRGGDWGCVQKKHIMTYVITGTWVNKGIGTIQMEKNGLVWTYVAPQLGNWIAAPPPSSGKTWSNLRFGFTIIILKSYSSA